MLAAGATQQQDMALKTYALCVALLEELGESGVLAQCCAVCLCLSMAYISMCSSPEGSVFGKHGRLYVGQFEPS